MKASFVSIKKENIQSKDDLNELRLHGLHKSIQSNTNFDVGSKQDMRSHLDHKDATFDENTESVDKYSNQKLDKCDFECEYKFFFFQQHMLRI